MFCLLQLDVVGQIDTVVMLLSPRQVHLLLDMFGVFSSPGGFGLGLLTSAFTEELYVPKRKHVFLRLPVCVAHKGGQEWTKDRKNRPMQQEDEYRLHMELNRCLKKDSPLTGTEPDFFESQTARTASSRGGE